jgi:hypothetical protein
MPQWMQDLTAGWPMIRANLPTFFVILVLMVGAVWVAFNWSYGGVLASKNGQIELQDRQLADYKQKLDGATPEQARAKIEALEHTINLTIGRRPNRGDPWIKGSKQRNKAADDRGRQGDLGPSDRE